MQHKTTIQAELAAFLKREGKTINQFAGISGVNSGTLSSIINGNRPIAMQQLDRITSGMGLPEGAFYELYIDECVVHSTPDWRRLGPFLQRCAELDKLECIRQVVQIIMDNITYAPVLFETAEEFYRQGKLQAAALLYEGVADSEKYQHSERLALCQYRLFTIRTGSDPEADFRAATRFEYFVERLDESDQLDALQGLAEIYLSLQHWDKIRLLSEELYHKAAIQYENMQHVPRRQEERKKPLRPLCYYILYAHWLQSVVCIEQGEYEQALYYVSRYSEMGWITEDSAAVREIREQFARRGEIEACMLRLLCGGQELLPAYVEYIGTAELGLLTGMLRLVEAANRFRWRIDELLTRFQPQLERLRLAGEEQQPVSAAADTAKYPALLYELALYYFTTDRQEQGVASLFHSLEAAAVLETEDSVLRSVRLFEEYRGAASAADQEYYKQLINRLQRSYAGRQARAAGRL
ncbi:helix-turn-helix transcriptional regulator [Paenibacillus sp. MMS20-IR301]|uniref:helix-turn-helix domain-containing protein n=1 Tax=Paenibacillus sp. MMS20-IR301 TaxID=2895946 RepID=UPI0028E717D9|nr:helix-turn-helix transcriptional regulator [Paenibacillus sp. MMS20-IR301]WNS46746.1 helix-turn-helix transcriptional regulator [Paenibacillus sp. MMS20-IR301]